MHLIYKSSFYSSDPGQAEYDELFNDIFMPGLYDFCILHERTGEIGLLPHSIPEKTRILYNEEHPCPPAFSKKNPVISVFLRPTESILDHALRIEDSSLVYYSPLGFCRHRSRSWRDESDEEAIRKRLEELSRLSVHKTLLFYGNLEHKRPQALKGLYKKFGLNVKIIKFNAETDDLYETMVKHKCFACLGMDGFSVGCWRDWELALSAVPAIRYTMAEWHRPFADPCGNYWVLYHYEEECGQIRQIEQEMRDGRAVSKLIKARDYALSVVTNTDLSETLESLACDNEFFKEHISKAEKAIPLFLEKARSIKKITQPPFIRIERNPKVIKRSGVPNPLLSIIVPVKGRLSHLKSTIPTMIPQKDAEVIVVDYSCPEKTMNWVINECPNTGVVSVPDQDKFNLSAARNAGILAAQGKAICFLDCDMIVQRDFSERILAILEEGTFIAFIDEGKNVRDGLAGMVACMKEDFVRAGKYDEGFLGWGCEDDDIKLKLKSIGLTLKKIDPGLANHMPHDDNERMKHAFVKNRYESWISNCAYKNRPNSTKHSKVDCRGGSAVGIWDATHRDWKGKVFIYPDGTFEGGIVHPNGTWEYENETLILNWYHWKPEKVSKINDQEFSSSFIKMKKIKDLGHPAPHLEQKKKKDSDSTGTLSL